MSYQDKALTCVECGNEFAFTANEQAFYADRGFTNEPKRCPNCRQSRKANRGGSGYSSGYESGGGSSGYASSGSGGGYQRGGGSSGGQREMHVTTCSNCGGEARVPFVPRGDKPVLCSDCFSQQRGGYSRSSSY